MGNGKKRTNGAMHFEAFRSVSETAEEILGEITSAAQVFPKERNYLAALVCRHSKMVCMNIGGALRSEEYNVFIDKLSEAAQAASRAQDILKFAARYHYIQDEIFRKIDSAYEDMFENVFEMLCSGERMLDRSRNNGKRSPVAREMVAVI